MSMKHISTSVVTIQSNGFLIGQLSSKARRFCLSLLWLIMNGKNSNKNEWLQIEALPQMWYFWSYQYRLFVVAIMTYYGATWGCQVSNTIVDDEYARMYRSTPVIVAFVTIWWPAGCLRYCARKILWRTTFTEKYHFCCLTIKDELYPCVFFNSEKVGTDSNNPSPPTHPHPFPLLPLIVEEHLKHEPLLVHFEAIMTPVQSIFPMLVNLPHIQCHGRLGYPSYPPYHFWTLYQEDLVFLVYTGCWVLSGHRLIQQKIENSQQIYMFCVALSNSGRIDFHRICSLWSRKANIEKLGNNSVECTLPRIIFESWTGALFPQIINIILNFQSDWNQQINTIFN